MQMEGEREGGRKHEDKDERENVGKRDSGEEEMNLNGDRK